MKRVLETHGGRLRDEERTIAANGIKEYSDILEKQTKNMAILQRCVCV